MRNLIYYAGLLILCIFFAYTGYYLKEENKRLYYENLWQREEIGILEEKLKSTEEQIEACSSLYGEALKTIEKKEMALTQAEKQVRYYQDKLRETEDHYKARLAMKDRDHQKELDNMERRHTHALADQQTIFKQEKREIKAAYNQQITHDRQEAARMLQDTVEYLRKRPINLFMQALCFWKPTRPYQTTAFGGTPIVIGPEDPCEELRKKEQKTTLFVLFQIVFLIIFALLTNGWLTRRRRQRRASFRK